MADRYNLSDEAVAAICTGLLTDMGIVTKNDRSQVIDRMKVHRARVNARTMELSQQELTNINAIFFDGRKDRTKVYANGRHSTISEEHISLVEEPGSYFIGHYPVETGDADTILNEMIKYLKSKFVEFDKLDAVGCDGAAVNTGWKGGVL